MANEFSGIYDKACVNFNSNFRDVFDYLSDEYSLKDDDYRIEKLLAVVKEQYSLFDLIEGYKYHYTNIVDKPHVIAEIAPSCILILKHALAMLGDDPITKQAIGKLESEMVFNRIDERELVEKLAEVIGIINNLPPTTAVGQ